MSVLALLDAVIEPTMVRRLRMLAYLGVKVEMWSGTDKDGCAEWVQPIGIGEAAYERVFCYWRGTRATQVHRRHDVTDSEWKKIKRTAVTDTQRKERQK